MTEYTYFAFDLVTGDVLGDVPLRGVSPRWELNDPGTVGDNIVVGLLGATLAQRASWAGITLPWRHGIAIDCDGSVIHAGVITGRRYSSSSGSYRLKVPGLLEYWRRRLIGTTLNFKQVDQFQIVRTLFASGAAPTIPLVLPTTVSGTLRDRTITGPEFPAVLDEVLELADNIGGYEFAIESAWASGSRKRVIHRLRLAAPRLGLTGVAAGLALEYPGEVREYEWDEDGEQLATDWFGTSQNTDGNTLVSSATNLTLLGRGYPRLMRHSTYSNITRIATLDDHVQNELAEGGRYANQPTIVVRDEGATKPGRWSVGDDVRVLITDDLRFPRVNDSLAPGLDSDDYRIQSASLAPETGLVTFVLAERPASG